MPMTLRELRYSIRRPLTGSARETVARQEVLEEVLKERALLIDSGSLGECNRRR
jgi:hypothetical protein